VHSVFLISLMLHEQREAPSDPGIPEERKPSGITAGPCNTEEIHKEWGDRLVQEMHVFTLQESYDEFRAKEELIQANPAWHVSTSCERLMYLQKAIRKKARDHSVIPCITSLMRAVKMYEKESGARVDWSEIVLPKLLGVLEEHNLTWHWQIPFCFDFHDMRSWGVSVAYDVLRKRVPWHAVVKLIRRKNVHEVLASQLSETEEDTDLLISACTQIDEMQGETQKNSGSVRNFCTFCSKKGHSVDACNSVRKRIRKVSTEYAIFQAKSPGIRSSSGRILISPPVYVTVSVCGHALRGRHSTGSDLSLIDWSVYSDLTAKTAVLKTSPHEILIKDALNRKIPSRFYVEGDVTCEGKSAGVHRFYIVDSEEGVPTVFGLSLLQACTQAGIPLGVPMGVSASRARDGTG
ncbi:uncharacterized protein NEMAJ01_1718, partial [Nematocida major]|uniref:uncharacterized protein n=1 Tax=Nematocida major TaxID=1912982 RepID=UPI002008C66F